MSIASDVEDGVADVLRPAWSVTDGTKVPESEDIVLRNGATRLDATYLYADMADSTNLAQKYKKEVTAKVIRCYLNAASRIIRRRGGEIRSFDGDRVMGIFIGNSKNSSAAKAALNITWAVQKVIQPQLEAKWSDFEWKMKHGVGIDTGEALLVRGGVFGNNDLISIGGAPNIAAKLSEIRKIYSAYISASVYSQLSDESKFADETNKANNMWSNCGSVTFGGKQIQYYGSTYHWKPA